MNNIVRQFRLFLIRCFASLLRQISLPNRAIIIAPHPDDEVFGCAGFIQKMIEAKKTVKILFMTGGGRSHEGCCQLSSDLIIYKRQECAKNVAAMLGLSTRDLYFLDYEDGSIAMEPTQTNLFIQIIKDYCPDAILIPHHRGEIWPDHSMSGYIADEIRKEHCQDARLIEYCVWFWHYNFWRVRFDCASIVKMNKDQYEKKLEAINYYTNDIAPCGNPYCGVLPIEFIRANSWNKELYFERYHGL